MQLRYWQKLKPAQRAAALTRPALGNDAALAARVAEIIGEVRSAGDAALRELTAKLDRVELDELEVGPEEFAAAEAALTRAQRSAIHAAADNIETFHRPQLPQAFAVDTMPGVRCERITRPIESVGLYVPAGSAPLPSTAIMLAVPARIAGCPARAIASSPGPDGKLHAAVLVAAELCGVDTVYKMGGAQAIAALAFGTDTVRKVDKIFGPGSAWVTAAKQIVAADPAGAAIDLPAGPSEVLVIADDSANAKFVAADLLAQAEHDTIAQVVLVTPSVPLAQRVLAEV